jgi:O-antigen/teichoic acid export membrane protein
MYQLLGHFSHLFFNVVTIALIARYLGVESYGKFSLILVILTSFIIFTDFGINDIVVRELSKDMSRAPRVIYDLVFIKILMGLTAMGLSILTVYVLNYSKEHLMLVSWTSLALIFVSLGSIGNNIIFRINLWMERSAIATLAKDIAFIASAYLAIFFESTIFGFILAIVIANLINVISVFILMRDVKISRVTPFDILFWKDVFRNALPLGVAYLVVTLYAGVDTILLDKMVGEAAVGYYQAAYKFIFQAIFIPVAFVNSLFPFMAEYYNNNREKLKLLFQKATDYIAIIAIPFGIFGCIIAPKLILLIYGENYLPSILSLRILVWAVVIMYFGIVCGYMMIALNEQRKSLIISIFALTINISLNLVLIPLYSFYGASIVTVITELAAILPTIYIIRRKLSLTFSWYVISKSVVISILCALLLIILNSFNVVIQLLISSSFYLIMIYFFKLVPHEDIQLVLDRAKVR